MKKRAVSILIASVLFFSNVGFASSAIEKDVDLTKEAKEEADEELNEQDEDYDYSFWGDDEPEYVKIAGFTELPDYLAHQEVKAGTPLSEIEFPQELEIQVVPDTDREERLIRRLGQERSGRVYSSDEGALEASLLSSEELEELEAKKKLEEEEASLEKSTDEEELIFFDSETGESSVGVITDEEQPSDYSGEGSEVSDTGDSVSSSDGDSVSISSDESSSGNTNEVLVIDEPQEPAVSEGADGASDDEKSELQDSGSTEGQSTDESSSGENAEGLVGMIRNAFGRFTVHAAEPKEISEDEVEDKGKDEDNIDEKEESQEETKIDGSDKADDSSWEEGDPQDPETEIDIADFEDEDGVSIERVSGIEWVLDKELNTAQEYNPDLVGAEYIFTPVMLIPDYYYIEAELPRVTIRIMEENFVFDKTADVDGVKIRVRADEGVFPEGSTIEAERLQDEEEKKVDKAIAQNSEDIGFVVKSYSFDIRILDRNGKEIEPDTEKGRVIVSFETEEAGNDELSAHIYHIKDSDSEIKAEKSLTRKKAETASDSDAENVEEDSADKEKSDEDKTGEEKAEEEKTEESAASEPEIVDMFVSSDGFVVEKLQALVVDGEETKAVEAVTDGFSKYTLWFTGDSFDIDNWPSDKNYVCLDWVLQQNGYLNPTSKLGIANPDTDIVYDDPTDSDYLYIKRLKNSAETNPSDGFKPDIDPVTSCYIEADDSNAQWFLVMRKPFKGVTKKIKIKCNRDGTIGTITLSIKDNIVTDASLAHPYPYGQDPGTADFILKVGIVPTTATGAVFQWQYKKTNDTLWKNIDLANTGTFGGDFAGASYVAGDWFRCLVNGVESEAVQVITADSDTRDWTGSYDGRCYFSNGTVAYTVDRSVANKPIIDVVGQFSKGGKAYMVQTSLGAAGWKMISSTSASPTSGSFATDTCELDDLYLGFNKDNVQELNVEADLKDTYKAFAIGTDCQIGSGAIPGNVPYQGTLLGSTNTNKQITRVSYIGIDGRDAAQTAMNQGLGSEYPAVSIVPVTTYGLRTWIGNSSTGKQPYVFASGNSAVKVDGDDTTYQVKLLNEKKQSSLAMSWINIDNGGTVEFKFVIGSMATATELKNLKDAKYEYSLSSSNIKGAKLVGDELKKYAITVANPNDSVLETMKFTSPSSIKTTLSSKLKSTYSDSSSSSSSSSTSSSTTSYKADYLDMTVYQTSDNSDYNNKTVQVIRQNSKDASSADMPLQIEISYDFKEKSNFKIFRDHNGYVQEFVESSSRADGTYTLDKDAGKIYIYSNKFSQYAIAYKPDVYYTVTFDDGTNKNTVKVKAEEKVARPADPTKEGYTFKGWYLKGTTTTTTTSTTANASTTASAFNFDTKITKDITLVAGWTSTKDDTPVDPKKQSDSGNDSRAPQTGDSLPVVWLWVVILAAGMLTFFITLKEIISARNSDGQPKPPTGIRKALLIAKIVIATTAKFIVKKIKQNKAKALLTASAAIVVIAAVVITSTMLQYKKAENLYAGAEETYVEQSSDPSAADSKEADSQAKEPHNWWDCVDVNVGELAREYPDVVGWIYFENEDISYPIMYSGDNSKYLSTAYTGEKARAGAIFIDGESSPDFSDPHSLVYGHNMRDLSMFGRLRYYKTNPDYYEEHQYFQVFTKDSVYRYQIFAFEEVPDNHDVFWTFGKEPANFYKTLEEVESASYIKSGIKANESDHVITLATCTNKDEERLIVCAVRTDEYQYQQ